MALPQKYVAKAAVTAAVIMKDKTAGELAVMQKQLETEKHRAQFSLDLQQELSSFLGVLTEEQRVEFCNDVTARLCASIKNRLACQ